MQAIGSDMLQYIASHGADITLTLGCTCTDFRDAMNDGSGLTFDIRTSLTSIGETAIQHELVSALHLSPKRVKLAEFKVRRLGPYMRCNVFKHSTAIELFFEHGGFYGLHKRMVRKASMQKKGKRE